MQDVGDLNITNEALKAGEKYYKGAIGSKEVNVSSKPTELSQHKAEELEKHVKQSAAAWEQRGELQRIRMIYQAEISFTWYCLRNNKKHPSDEQNLQSRLKTLQWIVSYL